MLNMARNTRRIFPSLPRALFLAVVVNLLSSPLALCELKEGKESIRSDAVAQNITSHAATRSLPYEKFLQTTQSTCGPAALRFFLALYGIDTEEAQLATIAETREGIGTTLLNLKSTAENFGMKMTGQRWNWARLIQEKNPAIAYVNDSHYVVVLKSDQDSVEYFDPGRGEVKKDKQEFLIAWKGIVLALNPETPQHSSLSFNIAPSSNRSGVALSLKQAVEMALVNGTAIRTAAEQLSLGKAQYDATLAVYTPKTELVFSSNRSFNKPGQAVIESNPAVSINTHETKYQWKTDKLASSTLGGKLTTIFDIGISVSDDSGSPRNEYSFGPSLSMDYLQPLTKAGRISVSAPLNKALNTWNETQLLYEQKLQDAIFQLANSYYNFVKSVRFVELTEENLRQTEKQLETAKVQFRLGNLAEIEVLKMEVQISRDKSAFLDAQKNYKSSEHQLAILLGAANLRDINPMNGIEYLPRDIKKAQMLDLALKQRGELQRLTYSRENLNIELGTAKSVADSYLSLGMKYQRKREGQGLNSASNNTDKEAWNIGVSLIVPLDDHGTTNSRMDATRAQLREMDISIEETKDKVAFEVDEAIRGLELSKVRYEILEKAVSLAKGNLDIDQLRFSRGVISSDEVQRTQLQLLQVKVDQFNALIDYKLSEVALAKATGTLAAEFL